MGKRERGGQIELRKGMRDKYRVGKRVVEHKLPTVLMETEENEIGRVREEKRLTN